MTASLIARTLLGLACLALLLAGCSCSQHQHRRSHSQQRRGNSLPNCQDYLTGSATSNVVILPALETDAYHQNVDVDNIDHCFPNKKLMGSLVKACDPNGLPPPSILSLSTLSQVVTCHTDGPCSSGMVISVTQFCS